MHRSKPQRDIYDWLGIRQTPNWRVARTLGPAVTVFITLLIAGAYLSAFSIVYRALFGGSTESLGVGALIAALLGAPFVVWGTVLKHQTLRYQKEGHITDRITSAVEQLGAQKAVNRIGRPVTIWNGKPKKISCAKELLQNYLDEPRSKVTGSDRHQRYDEETDEVWEGILYSISIWPSENTIIQWQGEEISLQDADGIGKVGDWQVFTETEPNIEVRIGSILSLERIAQDSTIHDNGRDHVRVMEILCAYVRENAPADQAPNFAFPKGCGQDTIEEKRKSTLSWFSGEITPRADVQLSLSVIGRRTPQQVKIERDHLTHDGIGYRINLSRTNLRYADLEYLNFENANFFRSQIQAAFCKGANFKGANFVYGELTGINASQADFSNSKVGFADFSHATLSNANLCGCKTSHTHFIGTNLNNAKLQFHENVNSGEVNRAFFVDCDLKGAIIKGDIFGVVFSLQARPEETIPREIYGVAFQTCRIAATRRFLGAERKESAIQVEWLGGTFGDASVILTDDMERPDHWPDLELLSHGDSSFDAEWRKWQTDPEGYVPPRVPAK